MQLVASFLFLQASALAAQTAARAPSFAPRSSPARNLRSGLTPRQSCDDGQVCADVCIPLEAMCCDVTVGIYCEAGETCTTQDTCCADGLNCDENVSGDGDCTDDEVQCGLGCMPEGAECCDESLSSFCYEGTTCLTSATCDLGDDDDSSSSLDDILGDDDDDSSSNDNSSSDDDDSNDDSSSNDDNDDNGNSNGNSNNDDDEDAGFSVGPSMAMVALGAALTIFF